MKRWVLVLSVVGACGGESKPKGPFGVLRDPKQSWTYEVVHGPSIDKLVPAAGQPQVICKVREWEETYSRKPSTEIRCSPMTDARSGQRIVDKQLFLVFDDKEGIVRELPGPGSPASEKGYALGFTFPSKVDGTWTTTAAIACSRRSRCAPALRR